MSSKKCFVSKEPVNTLKSDRLQVYSLNTNTHLPLQDCIEAV